VQGYYEDEAKKVLEPTLATISKQGWSADTVWRAGPAGDTIAEFAKQGGYELILMGSHGHGALARIVMGSVAAQVLAQCDVPVLLVR
jgi:nucleotide-binding universal stress UspA family protein